jgi:hypothetical protein
MLLLDIRSIINSDGLLGFKTYLSLILDKVINSKGKDRNTINNLALERLVAYYTNYRNVGDLDFRSGEIYNEILELTDKEYLKLATKFKALIDAGVTEHQDVDYSTFLKQVAVKDD